LISVSVWAQPNCNVFLYKGDTAQYRACQLAEKADRYYQFQREFQEVLDSSIAICPRFAYAYREKSVAYLKSGDFLTWKKLIDQAVALDTAGNLGYRGWCRYQFFRDYRGAIADIEWLDSLLQYDIGYSVNADYHLNFAKAICYSALHQHEKAVQIMLQQLNSKGYEPGLYDYFQLGVTYYRMGDYPQALVAFEKQSGRNELADNAYYRCKLYKQLGKTAPYREWKEKALQLYRNNRRLFDPYNRQFNSVYYETIWAE
jgi:tetratricopeptide (TPR) repeat protein